MKNSSDLDGILVIWLKNWAFNLASRFTHLFLTSYATEIFGYHRNTARILYDPKKCLLIMINLKNGKNYSATSKQYEFKWNSFILKFFGIYITSHFSSGKHRSQVKTFDFIQRRAIRLSMIKFSQPNSNLYISLSLGLHLGTSVPSIDMLLLNECALNISQIITSFR